MWGRKPLTWETLEKTQAWQTLGLAQEWECQTQREKHWRLPTWCPLKALLWNDNAKAENWRCVDWQGCENGKIGCLPTGPRTWEQRGVRGRDSYRWNPHIREQCSWSESKEWAKASNPRLKHKYENKWMHSTKSPSWSKNRSNAFKHRRPWMWGGWFQFTNHNRLSKFHNGLYF